MKGKGPGAKTPPALYMPSGFPRSPYTGSSVTEKNPSRLASNNRVYIICMFEQTATD
jgi:hypothetical protein